MLRLLPAAAVLASWATGADADEALCTLPAAPLACVGPKTSHEYIDQFLRASAYDKTLRPSCEDGGPTLIEAQFGLERLDMVDQKLGLITLSGRLNTWWNDPRLRFNGTSMGGCFDEVHLKGDDLVQWMWAPDLYITNLFSKSVDSLASSVTISADGVVSRTERMILKLTSKLTFGKLPFDKHTAKIGLGSYSQDISRLRLTSKGGEFRAGNSGVGIVAPAMTNYMWTIMGDSTEGFSTPGFVVVLDFLSTKYDELHLSFEFERKPKFHNEQVIMPSILFIIVSCIQFWVDPAIAPARATLAVIPILIMLTLSSSMYSSLPEGSERIWLVDNLTVLTFVCIYGALHFGVVQHCMITEKKRQANRDGLKVASSAQFLLRQADGEGKSLSELVERYKATDAAGAPTCAFDGEAPDTCRVSSADANSQSVKECELLFIAYVRDIFRKFDQDDSDRLAAHEVKSALSYFNVYVSDVQVMKIISSFLRDIGLESPEDEKTAEVNSTHFCMLLLGIDKYLVQSNSRTLRAYLQSMPASERWDTIARVFVPVFVIVQQIVMQPMVSTY